MYCKKPITLEPQYCVHDTEIQEHYEWYYKGSNHKVASSLSLMQASIPEHQIMQIRLYPFDNLTALAFLPRVDPRTSS